MTMSAFRWGRSRHVVLALPCVLTAASAVGCTGADRGATDLGNWSYALSEAEDPDVDAIAVAYYTRKHRVSEDEARRRLAIQDRATGLEDDLSRVLAGEYAGIWYDHDDGGRLKVGLTGAGARNREEVLSLLGGYGVSADSDLVAVAFSEAGLERIRDDVDARIMDMIESGHARTGYNTKENVVRVTALVRLPADEERRLDSIATIPGVSIRRLDEVTLRGATQSCNVTFCDPPLRGGRQIISNGSCTGAFIAHSNSDPNTLFEMTAGHCAFFNGGGFTAIWLAKTEANVLKSIGAQVGWLFSGAPGKDAGLILVNPSGFWGTPTPPAPTLVVKSSPDTTYDPGYKIFKDSLSSLGKLLCRTGAKTGTHCAEVSDLGDTISAQGPDGSTHTLKNMGELDMCDSIPGDSGGPIYKTHTAFGIFSGVATGVFTCFEFYQGIRGAEQALDVTLLFAQ
jgi:streptogrisin C